MKLILPGFPDLGLVTQGTLHSWAVTSPDDTERYVLGRMWDDYFTEGSTPRPLWVFGMMNPSTANHDTPDATITKNIGFTERGDAGGFIVVNMMARRETHPKNLVQMHKDGTNVVGEHNAAVLAWALSLPFGAGVNIAAWGALPGRLRVIAKPSIQQFMTSAPHCFGTSKDGSPRHTLMLAYSTPLVPYRPVVA